MKVQTEDNFCRVFELPEKYPSDYCFQGGHPVTIKMIDWFNPVQPGNEWSVETGESLCDFVLRKGYIKPGRKYLILTDFNIALVVTGKSQEKEE